jgi:5-methylcytosine-specific restriction enzyme A
MTQNPLIVKSVKDSYTGSCKGIADFSYRELPVSGAMNRIWVILEKLKFCLESKQTIKFRLLRLSEYMVEGKVTEIKTGDKVYPKDLVTIELTSGSKCLICIDEIDSNTIFPSDYEPIRFFQRTSISEDLRQEVFKRDNYECQIKSEGCQGKATEVDHIVPVSKGGLNNLENLQASCSSCNRKKSDKI